MCKGRVGEKGNGAIGTHPNEHREESGGGGGYGCRYFQDRYYI